MKNAMQKFVQFPLSLKWEVYEIRINIPVQSMFRPGQIIESETAGVCHSSVKEENNIKQMLSKPACLISV